MAVQQQRSRSGMSGDANFWRTEVSPRISELARAQEQTAVILERIQGQIAVQNNRLTALESQPASSRANATSLYQAVGTAVSVLTFFLGGFGCLFSPVVAGIIGLAGSLVFWLITSR